MKCQLKKCIPPTPLYPPALPHSLSVVPLVDSLFTVFILHYPEECSAAVDIFLLSWRWVMWDQGLEFPLAGNNQASALHIHRKCRFMTFQNFNCIHSLEPFSILQLQQQFSTFVAPGTGFVEDNFSMDGGEMILGMIQAYYIYCVLYFYYYYISSTSDHQSLDPRGWGPLSCRTFPISSQFSDRQNRTHTCVLAFLSWFSNIA